jgi:hypothetical protein
MFTNKMFTNYPLNLTNNYIYIINTKLLLLFDTFKPDPVVVIKLK